MKCIMFWILFISYDGLGWVNAGWIKNKVTLNIGRDLFCLAHYNGPAGSFQIPQHPLSEQDQAPQHPADMKENPFFSLLLCLSLSEGIPLSFSLCLRVSVSPSPESLRRDRWPDWRDGHAETSRAASGGAVPAGTNAADFLIGRMLSHICAHTRTHRHTPANTLRQACYACAQRWTVYLEMQHKLKHTC